MRVTGNLISNRFSRNLNTAANHLSEATEKSGTGRKFTRSSQNVGDAMKSFRIRRNLSRTDAYKSNIDDVAGTLDHVETTLMGINEILVEAKVAFSQGATGTMSDESREAVAGILEGIKDQILKLGNTNFAGKYIFGGPNTTEAPFSVNDGKMFYNGVNMDESTVSTDEIFIDMGLGMKHNSNGELQKQTAFSISTPGSVVFGYGVDENGLSNNVYNLLTDVINDIRSGDLSRVDKQMQKLTRCTDNVMVEVASVGEKVKFVEFLQDRLDSDEFSLQKKQSVLEFDDMGKALLEYNSAIAAYTAALQTGAKIISHSLLDFLR